VVVLLSYFAITNIELPTSPVDLLSIQAPYCAFDAGFIVTLPPALVVPTSKLPLESIRARSVELVANPTELAAGKNIPFVGAVEPLGITLFSVTFWLESMLTAAVPLVDSPTVFVPKYIPESRYREIS
jgi:hypothetical protein